SLLKFVLIPQNSSAPTRVKDQYPSAVKHGDDLLLLGKPDQVLEVLPENTVQEIAPLIEKQRQQPQNPPAQQPPQSQQPHNPPQQPQQSFPDIVSVITREEIFVLFFFLIYTIFLKLQI